MKKLILLTAALISLCSTLSIYAQNMEVELYDENNDQIRTVLNSVHISRISGFGGPTLNFSTVNEDFGVLVGGGGGIVINNFILGGYGEGLANTMDTNTGGTVRDLTFGHGGFWLGYEVAPKKVIHPVMHAKVGWGSVNALDNEQSKYINDNVFVFAPSILAEINMTQFFKMSIGVEYRQTFGVNKFTSLSDENFSAIGVNANFIFGWF